MSSWLFVCVADFGEVVVRVGTEVAEADEGLAAGVFDLYAATGGFVGDEDFILGAGAEADHHRCLYVEGADAAAALDGDPAARAGIFQRAACAGFERQLFRAEELLAIDRSVDDPAIGVAFAAALAVDDRF